jgi:hypothetical protein
VAVRKEREENTLHQAYVVVRCARWCMVSVVRHRGPFTFLFLGAGGRERVW